MTRDETLIRVFATQLKALRRDKRLSQEELAYRVGINRTYIAKLELGQNQPTLSVLYQLSKELDYGDLKLIDSTIESYKRLQID